jgi:hypothetical protein
LCGDHLEHHPQYLASTTRTTRTARASSTVCGPRPATTVTAGSTAVVVLIRPP